MREDNNAQEVIDTLWERIGYAFPSFGVGDQIHGDGITLVCVAQSVDEDYTPEARVKKARENTDFFNPEFKQFLDELAEQGTDRLFYSVGGGMQTGKRNYDLAFIGKKDGKTYSIRANVRGFTQRLKASEVIADAYEIPRFKGGIMVNSYNDEVYQEFDSVDDALSVIEELPVAETSVSYFEFHSNVMGENRFIILAERSNTRIMVEFEKGKIEDVLERLDRYKPRNNTAVAWITQERNMKY